MDILINPGDEDLKKILFRVEKGKNFPKPLKSKKKRRIGKRKTKAKEMGTLLSRIKINILKNEDGKIEFDIDFQDHTKKGSKKLVFLQKTMAGEGLRKFEEKIKGWMQTCKTVDLFSWKERKNAGNPGKKKINPLRINDENRKEIEKNEENLNIQIDNSGFKLGNMKKVKVNPTPLKGSNEQKGQLIVIEEEEGESEDQRISRRQKKARDGSLCNIE